MVSPDDPVVLTLFAGAELACEAIKHEPEIASWYAQRLDRLFPGFGHHTIGTYFVNWPAQPWIECGYSFPRPGLVTTVARELSLPYAPYDGRLVFAGEHTCPAFFGFMEGALESGLMAAGSIGESPEVGVLPEGNVHHALEVAADAGRG